jgi:hypothetical protein
MWSTNQSQVTTQTQIQAPTRLKLRPRKLSLTEEDEYAVDAAIIQERNEDLKVIEDECEMLCEITEDMCALVHEQKEMIDLALTHLQSAEISVNEARISLEQSETHQKNIVGTLVDAGTVALCVGLGAFGFFAGPIVGIPTLIAGGVVSGCVVLIRRTVSRKQDNQ